MVRLLFFGKLRDAAGDKSREITLPENVKTVSELVAFILVGDTALKEALTSTPLRYIVNEEMCTEHTSICNGDEIAFLPPVSGG